LSWHVWGLGVTVTIYPPIGLISGWTCVEVLLGPLTLGVRWHW